MKIAVWSLLWVVSMVISPSHGAPTKKPVDRGESAILYGRNFAYAVTTPAGWVLDSEAGKSQDLSVVFYRRGQIWQNGDAVIYININGRRPGVSLAQEAKEDVASFARRRPAPAVRPDLLLKTGDGRAALTYTFLFAQGKPPFEKSAYIQMPTITQTVVLTAKTRASYQAALKDFDSPIASLSFLTDEIKIKKAPAQSGPRKPQPNKTRHSAR